MNKTAFSNITIDIDYPRPFYNFPDLSSPLGNPYEFFPLVADELRKNGFSLESKQLLELRYRKYEEHFNNIAYFLDLSERKDILSEDEEFIYMKIRKDLPCTKQIPWFKISEKEEIKNMITKNHDFSEKNIYGRTFFHYIKDLEILEEMLQANKHHQWIDLLDFDNFQSHLLTSQQTIEGFNIVLKAFNECYPDLTGKIIFVKNNFNITPFNHINSLLSTQLNIQKESCLKIFADYLNLIHTKNPDIVASYINEFDNITSMKNLSKEEKNQKKYELINLLFLDKGNSIKNLKI